MRKIVFILLVMALMVMPVRAMDFTAPEAPENAQELMPAETESFGEGLWKVVKSAIAKLQPEVANAAKVCVALIAIVMLTSILRTLPGNAAHVTEFAATLAIAGCLLQQTNSMISLGAETVTELSEYGKLLIPVMTAAMAAQGGTTSSAAIYAGTAAFDAILSSAISGLLIPMVYMFLVLAVAGSAIGEEVLKKIREMILWLVTWCLKTILYVFTGYIGITGVVSGTADAAALKATKLTISGMVPVVGGILSDASEAVLVGAGVMKSAVGVYGLLAVIAICITPFLQIGIQYLMLKLTAAVCDAFDVKRASELIGDFSSAMGLLLGMTGTVCVLLLVSIVCLMKGVS